MPHVERGHRLTTPDRQKTDVHRVVPNGCYYCENDAYRCPNGDLTMCWPEKYVEKALEEHLADPKRECA